MLRLIQHSIRFCWHLARLAKELCATHMQCLTRTQGHVWWPSVMLQISRDLIHYALSRETCARKRLRNRYSGSPLKFVQVQLMKSTNADVGMMSVEPYIPGEYKKQTNNTNFVAANSDVGQAFTHFSHDFSGGDLMVTDIQGVKSNLTDPQIHSKSSIFGAGNLGPGGMDAFFMVHRCNDICKDLKLKCNPAQLQLPDQQGNGQIVTYDWPRHLSAYEVRKSARAACKENIKCDTAWIGDIQLTWPSETPFATWFNDQHGEPYVSAMRAEIRGFVTKSDSDSGELSFSGIDSDRLASELEQSDQRSTGEDWKEKAKLISEEYARNGILFVSRARLRGGHVLKAVNNKPVKGMSKSACLELLARYYCDVDTTDKVSMFFAEGRKQFRCKVSHKVHPSTPAKGSTSSTSNTSDNGTLHWLCGGKCGSFVVRNLSDGKYGAKLPTDVFCKDCTQKVHKSRHEKECHAEGCNELIKYYVFVLEVKGEREPELCDMCKKKNADEHVKRKQSEPTWRRKKCDECKKYIEFQIDSVSVPPLLCYECDQQEEFEYIPEDYIFVPSSIESSVEEKPSVKCHICDEVVSVDKGILFKCPGLHQFVLCGPDRCEGKLSKQGEELCKKKGKSGKTKLDTAKHRASAPCPTCMEPLSKDLLQDDVSSNASSVSLIAASCGNGEPGCVLFGSMVKSIDGLVRVEALQVGSALISADGKALSVRDIKTTRAQQQELVELRTESASLTVTSCHRILAKRGKQEPRKEHPVRAAALQIGDLVLVGGQEVEGANTCRGLLKRY
eukprot:TRINITY_DN39070_c0_g1_i1.p1 TRINITY_DN39070_c0_g1~~TRINITY_DN39070_c0_g1_i1.p1  ORF type:complete len:785 (+),score=85.63 TRINITY_DN39070_c0_g1_i1:1040-3394(+)